MINWKKGDFILDNRHNDNTYYVVCFNPILSVLRAYPLYAGIGKNSSSILESDVKVQIQDLPIPIPLWVYDQIGWYE